MNAAACFLAQFVAVASREPLNDECIRFEVFFTYLSLSRKTGTVLILEQSPLVLNLCTFVFWCNRPDDDLCWRSKLVARQHFVVCDCAHCMLHAQYVYCACLQHTASRAAGVHLTDWPSYVLSDCD